jgi:chitin-binding protein
MFKSGLNSARRFQAGIAFAGLLGMGMGVDSVRAHGLIEEPPSRMWKCGAETKPNEIAQGTAKTPACSTAFAINPIAGYNFMAVVTHTWGRSKVTPLPKHVCGFDGETWKGAQTPWDVPMAWPSNPAAPGPKSFTWNITWGPHFDDTKDFKYWITKSDFVFSPTKALTWDDFETEAFCSLEYDDKNPTSNPNVVPDKAKSLFKTTCQMPQRKGHHVVYGEWGRFEPTIERFHGCVDLDFGGVSVSIQSQSQSKMRMKAQSGSLPGRTWHVPFQDGLPVDALGKTRP